MTCKICYSKEVLDGDSVVCPVCTKLNILPKDKTIEICKKNYEWINSGFTQVLNKFEKRRLVVWLMGEREKLATQFFVDRPAIELSKFLSINVLIKRVVNSYEARGNEEANEINTHELIDLFAQFINIIEKLYLINENFGYYVIVENTDFEKLQPYEVMSKLRFVYDEEWLPIIKTFEQHLIMNEESAKIFFEKSKQEYEKNRTNQQTRVNLSIKDRIQQLYPFLEGFMAALNKSKPFSDVFDLSFLLDKKIPPEILMELALSFKHVNGLMNMIPADEFKSMLKSKFPQEQDELYKTLIFKPDNKNKFPIIAEFDGNVFISIDFIKIMALFYYPFYYKSLFDEETHRLSDIFEKVEVPDKLRKQGFNVITNITDKKNSTLEIDTVAWKDNTVYVVETKIWVSENFSNIGKYMDKELEI